MIPRIILDGDEESASYMTREGIRQLGILKELMSFNNLQQDIRKVEYIDGNRIVCRSCFGEDVIYIYAEKEKGIERLEPRFFAYTIKPDIMHGGYVKTYSWLYFNKKDNLLPKCDELRTARRISLDDDNELYVWEVSGTLRDTMFFSCEEKSSENHKELVEKMRAVPYSSSSVFTKAFMTYASDDIEKERGRRFAAAAHLMTSDYTNVFEPINWPNCIGNINPSPVPTYPRSAYCEPNNPNLVGLNLLCPPNRFYCNTDERMMVWYTAKSYNPEIYGQDFICGVILNLNTATIQSFTFYPDNGDGHGFTPYWTVECMHEIPFSMMTEVEELTEEELTVTIQWNRRPMRIRAFLKTGVIEYEEITTTEHRDWSGTESGFDKILFAEFEQSFEGPPSDHDVIVTQSEYDCSQHSGDIPSCDGHERELKGRDYSVAPPSDLRKHSAYDITFYGKIFSNASDKEYRHLGESISTRIQRCAHTMGGACFSQYIDLIKTRNINQDTEMKVANGVYASWINPNTAFVLRERDRDYLNGSADFYGYTYGGSTWNDWQDSCPLDAYPEYPITYECFYRFPAIPIDVWNRLGNETYSVVGPVKTLARDGTDDTDNLTEVNEYIVDEDIVLDGSIVDRVYYLDDRATKDDHGVIAAGRGIEDEISSNYWSVQWKREGINYLGIKDKLLEVLDCKMEELIDVGLV